MWKLVDKKHLNYFNSLGDHVLFIYRVDIEKDKFKWVVTIWQSKNYNPELHRKSFRFESNNLEKAKFFGLVRAKELGWVVDDLKI